MEAMKTADPELMRAINRFHVLDAIRRHGPIARVELGLRTELSSTTISAITAALLDDGLICPRHEGDLRNAGRGRPRVMLELNPAAARIVGVKVATDRMTFVVTDFQGDQLATLSLPMAGGPLPVPAVIALIEEGVRRCVAESKLMLAEVKAVCLALPGVIEHGAGHVRASPVLVTGGMSLAAVVAARLGVPVIVESDANAIAMAEHWFGHGREFDDFVLVSIASAIGLGVMHGGQLFRGSRGVSLNLGDMVVGSGEGGIERLSAGIGGGWALGIAIANLVALFAPPRVILVGSKSMLGAALLDSLRAAFASAVPPALAGLSEIVIDEVEDAFWARGAAAVALGELYGSPWGTTGPARRA